MTMRRGAIGVPERGREFEQRPTFTSGVDPCECGWAQRQAEFGTEICGLSEILVLYFLGDSRGAWGTER